MAIEVNNAVFHYPDGTLAVDDISFKVPTGSVTALVGPNGVGKSTFIKLLLGELQSMKGEVTLHPFNQVGYFAQQQLELLRMDESPLWHVQRQIR